MIHRITTAVAALLFAVTALSASANGAAPPGVTIAPGALLYVKASGSAGADTPGAWVVFRTARKVNPRLLVVRVATRSGRSYRIAGPNCVRSTVVTRSGTSAVRAGHRYTVRFYSRAGIGRTSPRRLVATRKLVARSFYAGNRRAAPNCSSS